MRLALLLLVACAALAEPYDRKLYKHWIDLDGDCQDTRQEVLIAESLHPVTLSEDGCKVTWGLWHCPYTGEAFTDPNSLDIDHLVPLREVHISGGSDWTAERRRHYANDLTDPLTLVAVFRGANRSKGARDPAKWLPVHMPCPYLMQWLLVKHRWNLYVDDTERRAILAKLSDCLTP